MSSVRIETAILLRGSRQNVSGQLSGFWTSRFAPSPPPVLAGYTNKNKNILISQIKKQGGNSLDISIQIAHSYAITFVLYSRAVGNTTIVLLSRLLVYLPLAP